MRHENESNVQLFAVTANGAQRLNILPGADSIHNMLDGLSLGVYSALRTFNHNQFLWLDAHLDRTEQSMALLGWQYRLDRLALRQALHQVCTAYPLPDARVRFDVLAEPAWQLGSDSRVLIALSPFVPVPDRYFETGVAVDVAMALRREQPLAKTAAFVLTRRPYPLGHPHAYEHLLLDGDGRILEGSSSNFYAVRKGVLWTAVDGVLEGVTRKIILKLAKMEGIPVREEATPLQEIDQFDEAFLSSSSRGLIPIVSIAGQAIGDGRLGPITRHLINRYQEFIAQEIKPAI